MFLVVFVVGVDGFCCLFVVVVFLFFFWGGGGEVERDWEREGESRGCEIVCMCGCWGACLRVCGCRGWGGTE